MFYYKVYNYSRSGNLPREKEMMLNAIRLAKELVRRSKEEK